MILVSAFRCNREGRGLNRSVHSLFAGLLQVCMVHVFLCRFRREKKSNMMSADLNKDLFVIFASGPIGVSLLLSITT